MYGKRPTASSHQHFVKARKVHMQKSLEKKEKKTELDMIPYQCQDIELYFHAQIDLRALFPERGKNDMKKQNYMNI